jgi:hypothetical protein
MGSMLVTNYQQFISYKESRKMLLDFSNQFGTEILSPDKLKPGKILIPLEQEIKLEGPTASPDKSDTNKNCKEVLD